MDVVVYYIVGTANAIRGEAISIDLKTVGISPVRKNQMGHPWLVWKIADDLDWQMVQAVLGLVHVIRIRLYDAEFFDERLVFELQVLDVFRGLGQDVGLIQS